MKSTKAILPIWQRRKLKFAVKEWHSHDSELDQSSHHGPQKPRSRAVMPILWVQMPETLLQSENLLSHGGNFFFTWFLVHLVLLQNTFLERLPLRVHLPYLVCSEADSSHQPHLEIVIFAWTLPVTDSSLPSGAVHCWERFLFDWASIPARNVIPWKVLRLGSRQKSSSEKLRLRQTWLRA